jgi:hypothetical protein
VNILAIGRFQMAAGDGVDTEDPQALPLMIQTIASCVIEEDEDRFLNLATRRRADPELLLKIVQAVLEAQTGRPTEAPVDSSAGSVETTQNSKALSSSPEPSAPKTWLDTPFARRELAADPDRFADIKSIAEHGAGLAAV